MTNKNKPLAKRCTPPKSSILNPKSFCLLYYYVPKSHLAATKTAVFAAGAGKIGKYSNCAWETLGTGQFLPQTGSKAYIGKVGKISRIKEYKVEVICRARDRKKIVAALKQAHPYEEPAYGLVRIED